MLRRIRTGAQWFVWPILVDIEQKMKFPFASFFRVTHSLLASQFRVENFIPFTQSTFKFKIL